MGRKKRETRPETSAEPSEATDEAPEATAPTFLLSLTAPARRQIDTLARTDVRRHRKVLKTLGLLSRDPRYPGLNSHKYESQKGPTGEDVWESYVENNTPAAYRVFWYYGPDEGVITVLAVTPHP